MYIVMALGALPMGATYNLDNLAFSTTRGGARVFAFGGGGGGWRLRHNFFSDFKILLLLHEIHNGALLLHCVSRVTVKKLAVDMSLLLPNFSFSVCATKTPN